MSVKPPNTDAGAALIQAFRLATNQDAAFDRLAARALGVSEGDLHCLNIIQSAGGLTAGELASRAGVTSGAVTGMLDRLQRVGYARRVADRADRRRVRVEVTPAFERASARIWGPLARDWRSTLIEGFTPEELAATTALLERSARLAARHAARLESVSK